MRLHTSSGVVVTGDRWLAPAGAVDARVLAGLRGPVLDVGCGPGRHVRALLERGVVALGIDVTPQLVETALGGGVVGCCCCAPTDPAADSRGIRNEDHRTLIERI